MPEDVRNTQRIEIAQMPLAHIRAAERLIRERAAAATAGPWAARHGGMSWVALYDDEDKIPEGESLPSFEPGGSTTSADVAHVATWHPLVALAVADWLHIAGADLWAHGPLCECGTGCDACDDNLWEPHARAALALADVVLPPEGSAS